MRHKSFALISAAAILALGGFTASSYGQAVTKAVADGNWATSATWDNGVPAASTLGNAGSGSGAEINGTHTVTVDSSGDSANFVEVGDNSGDSPTLVVNSGDLTISDPAGSNGKQILNIGKAAGSNGTLTQTGGSITIDGANNNTTDGHLYVGDAGNGTYNISGGSLTASDEIFIGGANGGTGTINATGGTITASGRNILVGGLGIAGTGTLNVGGTATVTANSTFFTGIFGNNITSNVTVNGNGTLQTAADPATISNNFLLGSAFSAPGGSPSTTNFAIADNGTVSTDFFFAGFGAGATVTVTQTGGTLTTIGTIIGENGASATYNQSAGTINAGGSSISSVTVGEVGGPGTYNLSGTGTLNANANLYCGRFGVGGGSAPGSSGAGTINQSGGSITVADNVYLGNFDGTTGVINHSGGDLHVVGDLNVAGQLADNGGQAINVTGTFSDIGDSGSIQIDGNLHANSGANTRTDGVNGTSGEQTYLNFGLDTTGVTLLNVTGTADLTGAIIDVYANPGAVFSMNQVFPLLTAGGGFVGGNYLLPSDIAPLAALPNDVKFALSESNNTLYATVVAVPEPASLGLLFAAGLGLAARRRRRS